MSTATLTPAGAVRKLREVNARFAPQRTLARDIKLIRYWESKENRKLARLASKLSEQAIYGIIRRHDKAVAGQKVALRIPAVAAKSVVKKEPATYVC